VEAKQRVAAAQRTLAIDAMTAEVASALQAVGVDPILLKGPTFASLLYPEGGRIYADSDLLVPLTTLPAARRVLGELGFVDLQAGFAACERSPDAEAYMRAAPEAHVDLHWNIHLAPDPETTWRVLSAERETMTLGGVTVDILNVPARAFHVVLHAAQHGLDGPQRDGTGGQTGEDLRRAIRICGHGDWQRAATIADALGAVEPFAYGLRLDAGGRDLADSLGLPESAPQVWGHRSPMPFPRGGFTINRVMTTPSLSAKANVLFRSVIPSRARVRQVADTAIGRKTLAGAYAEFWFDTLRNVVPAARSIRAFRKSH
jgi:hypothetical protein